MKYSLTTAIVAVLSGIVSGAQTFPEDPVPQRVTKVVELFRSASDWETFTREGGLNNDTNRIFTIGDGRMLVTGEGYGYAVTRKAYRDYRLKCDFRWVGKGWGPRRNKPPDSGVLVHSVGPHGAYWNTWMLSFEVNLMPGNSGDMVQVASWEWPSVLSGKARVDSEYRWDPNGRLVDFGRTNDVLSAFHPPEPQRADIRRKAVYPENPVGEWNALEIVCDGSRIAAYLNGVKTSEVFDVNPSGGRIQLQTEGHGVEYRNLVLEPMPQGETVSQHKSITQEYGKPDKTPIVFGGWSRSDCADAEEYCMYLDIWYEDGELIYGQRAAWNQGTHDWEEVKGVFVPLKPVKKICCHAFLRKGMGSAEFRGVYLERRMPEKGEKFYMCTRSDAPFSDNDVEMWDEFEPPRKLVQKMRRVPARRAPKSTVPYGSVRVWTADSMRTVSPLTFPGTDERTSIDLDLAGRERESAQICISSAPDMEWKDCTIVLPKVLKTEKFEVFKGKLSWQRVGYIPRRPAYQHIGHPEAVPASELWIPDPLLPPAKFRVRKGATQGVWITVEADADAKMGVYRGEVQVRSEGKIKAVVPISVQVRRFALPETFGLKTCFSLMDGFTKMKYGPRFRQMKTQAIDVMLDHRLNPDDITRYLPPDIPDLLHARKRGMNLFNILNIVPLPKNTNSLWSCYVSAKETESDEFYNAFKSRLEPYVSELRKHDLVKYAYIYGYDERPEPYFKGIDAFWRKFKRDFPDIPMMTTAKMFGDLAAGKTNSPYLVTTDWYCPTTKTYDPDTAKFLRSKGKKVLWYTCCGPRYPYANMASVEYPAKEGRLVLGFMTHLYNADGFLFWHVNNWKRSHTDPLGYLDEYDTFSPEWKIEQYHISWPVTACPGDGVFLYPGKNNVLPSIRLANVRDGEEDWEWLQIAAGKVGFERVDMLSRELVQDLTKFETDPEKIRAIRRRIGDLAESGAFR